MVNRKFKTSKKTSGNPKTKVAKEVKKIDNIVHNIQNKMNKISISRRKRNKPRNKGKTVSTNSHCHGTFESCLRDPKKYLARIPQSMSKSIIVKLVRSFQIQANTLGNIGFLFMPQILNDVSNNATGTSPFWKLINNTWNGGTAIITPGDGWLAHDVGSQINAAFSGARCISARIELCPNVSITNAIGRGMIAMTKIKTDKTLLMKPSDFAGPVYSNLQLSDVVMASPYVSVADISKMQGLSANWIAHEANDYLDYPGINFTTIGDVASRHPTENVIFGNFLGVGAGAFVNVKIYLNVELLPDSTIVGAGIFPSLAQYADEKIEPLSIVRKVYESTPNFCHTMDMAGNDS